MLIGATRGVESRILPTRDFRFHLLPTEPIYRRTWWKNFRWPFVAGRLLREVARVFERERPAAVIGTGGYASGPVVWWAARHGIPTAIQEQNAYPGLASRWLSRRVRHVYLGLPEAAAPAPLRARDQGVRYRQPDHSSEPANGAMPRRRSSGWTAGAPWSWLREAARGRWPSIAPWPGGSTPAGPGTLSLIWVTGRGTHEEFARYHRPPEVHVVDFLDPMADGYAVADLVVSRAGMITVAELCAWGLPSVLVPLPTAAADHQTHNARVLAKPPGLRCLLPQSELTAQTAGAKRSPALLERSGPPEARWASGPWRADSPSAARDIVSNLLTLAFVSRALSELAATSYISPSNMALFNPSDTRTVHFMGIGGAGMSALALIACRRGLP